MCRDCVEEIKREAVEIPGGPKFFIGTTAYHLLGDISREGDICCVSKETENYFIGNWLTGYGFFNVIFPKETTKKVGIPKKAMIVKTKNSVYRFGKADEEGKRNVSRDNKPLNFSECKIEVLFVGCPMILDWFDEQLIFQTSPVKSIDIID